MEAVQESGLVKVLADKGIVAETQERLIAAFLPLHQRAETLVADAGKINVTDATQVSEMKQARAARLALKAVRVEVEKARKEQKETALRFGQGVDMLARVISDLIEPEEKRLEDAEKFAERAEAERKAKLKAEREQMLRRYNVTTVITGLGDMTEEQFSAMLEGYRVRCEQEAEALRKAAEERAAAEKARAEEEAHIRAENERLRREREEADRAAQAEREKAAAEARAAAEKARKEREAIEAKARAEREKAEAEAREERRKREEVEAKLAAEKRAAEAKAKAEALAAKKAAAAPDATKLRAYADALRAVPLPALKADGADGKLEQIDKAVNGLAVWIREIADEL